MQEDIENKSVTLIIKSGKLTGRTLATAFTRFLRYSRNKIREHNRVKPQGKQTVRDLIGQNQGVESTELKDREELKTFERIAKQYGVDYAIQKGLSAEGKERYILFFKARDRSAIDQAMSVYVTDYIKGHDRDRPPVATVPDPVKETLSQSRKHRVRDRGLAR